MDAFNAALSARLATEAAAREVVRQKRLRIQGAWRALLPRIPQYVASQLVASRQIRFGYEENIDVKDEITMDELEAAVPGLDERGCGCYDTTDVDENTYRDLLDLILRKGWVHEVVDRSTLLVDDCSTMSWGDQASYLFNAPNYRDAEITESIMTAWLAFAERRATQSNTWHLDTSCEEVQEAREERRLSGMAVASVPKWMVPVVREGPAENYRTVHFGNMAGPFGYKQLPAVVRHLKSLCGSYGEVVNCVVVMDKSKAQSRGFAFVEMAKATDAEALFMDLRIEKESFVSKAKRLLTVTGTDGQQHSAEMWVDLALTNGAKSKEQVLREAEEKRAAKVKAEEDERIRLANAGHVKQLEAALKREAMRKAVQKAAEEQMGAAVKAPTYAAIAAIVPEPVVVVAILPEGKALWQGETLEVFDKKKGAALACEALAEFWACDEDEDEGEAGADGWLERSMRL